MFILVVIVGLKYFLDMKSYVDFESFGFNF